jgi:hypothetical protein
MVRTAKFAVASLLGLAVVFLAWRIIAPDDAPITGVYVRSDGRQLEVGVGTCNQDPQVTVVETEGEVRLSSNEVLPRGGSNDCLDHDNVTLDSPLGDRIVIDEASGDEVRVRAAE